MKALRRYLTDYNNPRSLGSRMRARRSAPILRLIEEAHERLGRCNILDVGGTLNYWGIIPRDFLRAHGVKILLLNRETVPIPEKDRDIFSSEAGDACDLSQYADDQFDLVHSNSVIEHVGLFRDMARMASELRRVARAYYVQTPNFWFPIEPHYLFPFLHWMPFSWRVTLATWTPMGGWPKAKSVAEAAAAQQAAILLDRKMMAALFPDAPIRKERVLGLPKSLIAIRTAGS